MSSTRVVILVLDACGIGAAPDADAYGDHGAATIPHVAAAVGGLMMPNAHMLGLGCIAEIKGVPSVDHAAAAYGILEPSSAGKDSTTGHWELAGVLLDRPFPLFPDGFPEELVARFEQEAGVEVIGNIPASGTEIIERLSEKHFRTGKLILYTSADSVFQLAAHEEMYPVERLYEFCRVARSLLQGEYGVARVIARPFAGEPGRLYRTARRRDFSLPPTGETVLDSATEAGLRVLSIGKIHDLFDGRGIATAIKTANNSEVMAALQQVVESDSEHQFIFGNCVDFDMFWGHRNDPIGFARGLEQFDIALGRLLPKLREDDILFITADHGCDPTITTSTDHTRECAPLLAYGKHIRPGDRIGMRTTFADLGATVADVLDISLPRAGRSFLGKIRK